jgi:LPS sulfotransferase NodH
VSSAVEISAVRMPGKASDSVLGARLDSPSNGSGAQGWTIELSGWVVTDPAPARSLRVVWVGEHHSKAGEVLCQVPVDMPRPDLASMFPDHEHASRSGFSVDIGALRLPPRFRLELRLVMENGEVLKFAELEGSREPLTAEAAPPSGRLRPAVIVTTGRAGSTWLSHLLNQHPELVAYRPFKREPRIAAYWLEVVQALSDPASYKQSLQPNLGRGPLWWLGNWPEASRNALNDEVAAELLGRDTPELLIEFARERVEAFYRRIAREQGKGSPAFFVEKSPGLRLRQMELIAETFPGMRDIVLLRDPRDVLCSILAYKQKNPAAVLVRQEPGLDDEFLERLALSYRAAIAHTKRVGERAVVTRYEDLVAEPAATLERMLEHLRVDHDPATIEAMIDSRFEGMEVHQTAPSVGESVGRWRRDLPSEAQERVGRIFEEPLEWLGYE